MARRYDWLRWTVGLAALLPIGCTLMFRNTVQDVALSSAPEGANVKSVSQPPSPLSCGDAKCSFECVTPCTLRLPRWRKYTVTFQKEGYSDKAIGIDRHFTPHWFVVDTMLWAPFSFIWWNSFWNLDPDNASVVLEPTTAQAR